MAKFWKVLKVIIFSVGALTLALIAYGLFISYVPPLFKSSKARTADAPAEETVYEKKENGYALVVKRKETQSDDEYLLTLTRNSSTVVKNYRLPTQKYDVTYINIYDASFMQLRDGEPGIVLYCSFEDGEGASDSQIWFIRAGSSPSVREVLSLSDVHHAASSGEQTIIGTRRISLPYEEDFRFASFVVPVMVRVSDSISISPLLSSTGVEVLHAAMEKEIRARMDKKDKDRKEKKKDDKKEDKEEDTSEQYRKARKEIGEALADKTVVF